MTNLWSFSTTITCGTDSRHRKERRVIHMNVYLYTLAAYAATAVISLAVVGVIVLVNKVFSEKEGETKA